MASKIRVLKTLGDMPLWDDAVARAGREESGPEPVAQVGDREEAGRRRIGLFVDAENVRLGCLGEAIEGLLREGEVRIRRAFGQWSAEMRAGDAAVHVKHAIELRQCPLLTRCGKNAADIAMVVDVMAELGRDELEVFALVSSDSDFTPLVQHLKRAGKEVWGFGLPNAPQALREACVRFEVIGGMADGDETSAGDGMKTGPWSVLRKVVWQAKQRKADGWKMLTEVGSALSEEGLSAKDLGCASLSEACRQLPELEVEQAEGSGGCLVRFKERSTAFTKREEKILRNAIGVIVSESGWGRIADLAKELRDNDAWDFWRHQGRLKKRLAKLPWVEWHGEDAQLMRALG